MIERLAEQYLRLLENQALSALLIGVVCQVSILLTAGSIIHWFYRLAEGQGSFWSGLTVLTILVCLLGPFVMLFKGDR